MSRLALQTAVRAGAVALVDGYRQASGVKLGLAHRARPSKITPPAAFVDSMGEDTTQFTAEEAQRVVRVGIRLVWGQYNSGTAVDQRDAFVDGFYGHVMDNPHAFGGNAECDWLGTADDEQWSPSWIPEDESSYFSTLVTLEGRAST